MQEFMKLYGRDICNTIVGALIAWGMSYIYYVKAGEELVAETQQLRTLHNTTLLALQNLQNKNASFQLSPDAKGDLTQMGVNVTVSGTEATTTAPQGSASAK
jgi:hypothetical protein